MMKSETYKALITKAEELFSGFSATERKLFGKIANSSDPVIYLEGIVDALDINGIEISDSFIELRNYMVEYYSF